MDVAAGRDEWEDVVLVFRSILGSPDRTGCGPDPGLHGFSVTVMIFHQEVQYPIY